MRMLSVPFSLFYVDVLNLLFMFLQLNDTLEKVCKMVQYFILGKSSGGRRSPENILNYYVLIIFYLLQKEIILQERS